MAIAYESVTSTSTTAGPSVTITKPSGLAVGDEMYAQIICFGASLTTPTGWTAIYNAVMVNSPIAVFSKTADSGDVAASDFTFTGSTISQISGTILHVSGLGIVDDSASVVMSGTSPAVTASAITPVWPNSLDIIFLFGRLNSNSAISFSTPSIATDNPIWTSRSSDSYASTNSFGRAVYTAPRSAITAWGDLTSTFSPTLTNAFFVALSLAPKIDGSYTVVTGTSNFVNHPFLRTGAMTLDGIDPETASTNVTQWTNPDKPSTAWTNPNK